MISSISITGSGLDKLEEATPIWLQLQEKVENSIGEDKYSDLLETLSTLQNSIE